MSRSPARTIAPKKRDYPLRGLSVFLYNPSQLRYEAWFSPTFLLGRTAQIDLSTRGIGCQKAMSRGVLFKEPIRGDQVWIQGSVGCGDRGGFARARVWLQHRGSRAGAFGRTGRWCTVKGPETKPPAPPVTPPKTDEAKPKP